PPASLLPYTTLFRSGPGIPVPSSDHRRMHDLEQDQQNAYGGEMRRGIPVPISDASNGERDESNACSKERDAPLTHQGARVRRWRSEEHTSELQSREN